MLAHADRPLFSLGRIGSSRSGGVNRWIAKLLGASFAASLAVAVLPGGIAVAQDVAPTVRNPSPASAEARQREEWRTSIQRTPLPRNGCFIAAFPSTNWQEVPCGKAPPAPSMPAHGIRPFIVGSSDDESAQTTGMISSAVGSFDKVIGVTSERESGANNNYQLQLNTNNFATAFCTGATNPSNCKGWQQFIFSNLPDSINFSTGCSFVAGACAYMQYWLLGYGNSCPSGWMSYGADCYRNSDNAVSVDRQEIDVLGRLILTGSASGNSDTVTFIDAGDQAHALSQPTILSLNQGWQLAEFNVFGNCCLTQAGFNIGSTIIVRTSINDGTTNAPACVNTGTTGETNNLTIVGPCTPAGGASPSIVFTERFLGPVAALQPLFVSDFNDQQHFTFLAANGQVWDAYACPDCDDATWHLQQINGLGGLTNAPLAMSGPSVGVYSTANQQHFAYLAANGAIIDAFYCPQCNGAQWRVQQINLGGSGVTNGPAAVTAPSVDEFVGHDQQHFAYLAANGTIFDAYYCPKCSGNPWKLQQINGPGGLTEAPIAVTQPFISTYAAHDQQHFAYLSSDGELWDVIIALSAAGISGESSSSTSAAAASPMLRPPSRHPSSMSTSRPISSISPIWRPMARSGTSITAHNAAAIRGRSSRSISGASPAARRPRHGLS
jgi:hypothetical protein